MFDLVERGRDTTGRERERERKGRRSQKKKRREFERKDIIESMKRGLTLFSSTVYKSSHGKFKFSMNSCPR